ncbi:4-alpha-glucanotransferase [Prosthecobacter sp. SYSU 5D2]|uniref:4-alpha-glucanotransferase n=1 Tax=Prosthecobacter sp. SYSU 5D2 TaxID=3134134 RepID=UPI0031FF06FF
MFSIPRSSGILLHPTSLPGRFGIGEIGPEAHEWLDRLHRMGQKLWQMLPLGPTGYGASPYQSLSSFAGNPLMISFDALRQDGVLKPEDLAMIPAFPDHKVNFIATEEVRSAFLKLACQRFLAQCGASPLLKHAFEAFCEREADWLEDYAMFIAIKGENGGRPWNEWPRELAMRNPEAIAGAMVRLEESIEEVKAQQFFFFRQWQKLHARAQELGISLIGDIPIFTAHDSADVWARPDLFELDEHGGPVTVAGVPPDYFSATGQRWGNPLYKWSAHEAEGFAWWKSRLRKTLEMVDIVRIDHFRGFAAYWEIPASEPTAVNGRWVGAPGDALFEALKGEMGDHVPVIAEDLGIITPDVTELRLRHGFPGMKVMQFAFGADTLSEDYIPENYPDECVAYTGTHDNDTVQGLFNSGVGEDTTRTAEQVEAERRTILGYTGTDGNDLHWDFIHAVWKSRARMAVAPLQDLMGLGSESRMNTPGKMGDFWSWRFTWDQLSPEMEARMLAITQESGRQ